MSDETKERLPLITTPEPMRCKSYAKLQTPDEKYGNYTVKLVAGPDEPGYEWAQSIVEQIDEMAQTALDSARAAFNKNPKKGKKFVDKFADKPYSVDEETGEITLNFKKGGSFEKTRDDGTKVSIPLTLAFFDAKGHKIPREPEIKLGADSLLKVSFNMSGFHKGIGASVSIRLVAAKLIKLVEWEAGGDADALGLGGEEDGYEYAGVSDEDKAEATATGMDAPDEVDETDDEAGEEDGPSEEELAEAATKAAALAAKKGKAKPAVNVSVAAKLPIPAHDKKPAAKATPVATGKGKTDAKSSKPAPAPKKKAADENEGDF